MQYRMLVAASVALISAALSCKTTSSNTGLKQSLPNGNSAFMQADSAGFRVNGQYRFLRGGTLQWWRIDESQWEDRIQRFKSLGFNTIDLYVPWNIIEPQESVFNFEQPNLKRFLDLTQSYGLWVYLRPGPYITNEMDGGGVPGWLMTRSSKKTLDADGLVNFRTDDPDYLAYVKKYLHAVNSFMKPYLITQQGPIILYSLENEYNWFEQFFKVDKFFKYQGDWERDKNQTLNVRNYLESLALMVREDGIDIPLTTCPGDGYVSGMNNARGLIPMPNIYGSGLQDQKAYKVVADMHDPQQFEGVYQSYPSGATETERSTIVMNKLLFAGMDAYFGFNIIGHSTPGYNNSLTMDNDLKKVIDFRFGNLSSLFFRPVVGLFSGVIDYYGAVSPSGINREKFNIFRRFNLFYDTFEQQLAPQGLPKVTINKPGSAQQGIEIDHPGIGSVQDKSRVIYWYEVKGTRFFHIVNETMNDISLPPGSITLKDRKIPQFTNLEIESLSYPGERATAGDEVAASHMLVTDLLLEAGVTLDYTTSQILSMQKREAETWVLLYGKAGSEGEISLSSQASLNPDPASIGLKPIKSEGGRLVFTYKYEGMQNLTLVSSGHTFRFLVMDTALAGRTWILKDRVLAGLDYVAPQRDQQTLLAEQGDRGQLVYSFPDLPLSAAGLSKKSVEAGVGRYSLDFSEPIPAFSMKISSVATRNFNLSGDGKRISWKGEPKELESMGIYKGRATYEVRVNLETDPALDKNPYELYVEHASDFISIFINGRYVSSVLPLGTPIQSAGSERYAIAGLKAFLKQGDNVIQFATEIWGHGSFMFPRGNLFPTPSSIPSVGFDSVKGLWGKARLGDLPLESWSLTTDENEQTQRQASLGAAEFGDVKSLPLQLTKGQRLWVNLKIPANLLPSETSLHAPIAMELKGKNLRGTLFAKGQVIGRWISDAAWIQQGNWVQVVRDIWSRLSVDDFPLLMRTEAGDGEWTLLLEDMSSPLEAPGILNSLLLKDAEEERAMLNGKQILVPQPLHRVKLRMEL